MPKVKPTTNLPNCSATFRTIVFFVHVPWFCFQLQQAFKGGRKVFHSYTIELDAAKSPLRSLIEKAIGWSKVSSAQSCLVTNPRVPFSCDDPLPIDPETDTLEKVASNSRFVVVRTKSAAAEQTAAFIQKIPFLARINRIQHLGRDSQ